MHNIWVTADTHFGHRFMAAMRGFGELVEGEASGKPRATDLEVLAHDLWLTEQWNGTIRPGDEVYFLGDLSFLDAEGTEILFNVLHGRKHLIVGNHDPNRVQKLGWETVNQMLNRKLCGHSYFMCHYPMLTWPNSHHGTRHLHGHSHGNLDNPTRTTRIDVGFDAMGYILNVEELDSVFTSQGLEYDKVDHH